MATSLPARSERKFLSKELISFNTSLSRVFRGSGLVSNPDPVLVYLAQSDERAYRTMERNNDAVSSGRQHRDNSVISQGFSILRNKKSKSAGSKRLHDFTISWFKQIENLHEVRKRTFDAMYHGWRPLEQTFTEFSYRSRTYMVPTKIREKNQENFKFTTERDLAHYDRIKGEYIIFDNDISRLKWFCPSYGSLDIPYGCGIYQNVFLVHFAKDKFFEMFTQGMQRSLGLVKAKQGGLSHLSGPAASKAEGEVLDAKSVMNQVVSDIRQMIDVLNSNNVLLEKSGWSLEFLNNISFADGWIKALEYVDKKVTLVVAGESLSFQEAQFGSRAQAVQHAESKNQNSMVDGMWYDSMMDDRFIKPVLEYNHGEIDPDDMPSHVSHARIPLTLSDIKQAFDMGMALDADEIARRFNLPMADDDTENILKMVNPKKDTGPNREDSGNDPVKKTQDEDEATRRERTN